jgi:hypothetical protein
MQSYWQGQTANIQELVVRVQPRIDRLATPTNRANFFKGMMAVLMRRDRYMISPELVAYTKGWLEASLLIHNLAEQAFAQFNLGFVYLWRGDLDDAEREMLEALALAQRIGDITLQSRCLNYLTILERLRGNASAAQTYCAESETIATVAQMAEYVGGVRANLAWLAWRDAKLTEVLTLGTDALAHWNASMRAYPFKWTALWPLIGATLARNNLPQAVEFVREMLAQTQMRLPAQLETALEAVVRAADADDLSAAQTYLQGALDLARDLGFL